MPSNEATSPIKVWEIEPTEERLGVVTEAFYSASPEAQTQTREEASATVQLFGAGAWRDPDAYLGNAVYTDARGLREATADHTELQAKLWAKYNTSPVISNAIETTCDMAVGSQFGIRGTIPEIDEVVRRHTYSPENDLVPGVGGWLRCMLVDGELFLLCVIDQKGSAMGRETENAPFVRIREMSPGEFPCDGRGMTSLIKSKTDPRTVLAYVRGAKGSRRDTREWIPSWAVLENPRRWLPELKKAKGFREALIKPSLMPNRKRGAFRPFGGFYRFIIHWKTLTGIRYQDRSTAALRTSLRWVNLYEQAVEWRMDHLKAQASWTIQVGFEESPQGKTAYRLWMSMSDAAKDKTGLTKVLAPGSRVFTPPGMFIKIHNPQLDSLSGQNQDLLTHAGAGTGTPQDIFTGNVSDATFGALKATRSPFAMKISSLQYKLDHFLKHTVFRAILIVDERLEGATKKTYPKKQVSGIKDKKPQFKDADFDPWWFIDVAFPPVNMTEDESIIRQMLGSKHPGAQKLGLSRLGMLKRLGVTDPETQMQARQVEDELLGDLDVTTDQESKSENELTKSDPEKPVATKKKAEQKS